MNCKQLRFKTVTKKQKKKRKGKSERPANLLLPPPILGIGTITLYVNLSCDQSKAQ